MKKILSVLLSVTMLIVPLSAGASAKETVSGTLNILTYNVSGIPVFGDSQGTQDEFKGGDRMEKIGELICSQSGCDIVGTQEDFDNHDSLAQAMPDYEYQTLSSGSLPLGDGLNAFSKYPVYNVRRTEWELTYGVVSGSADKLAEKGILSCVVEIADDVYIDLYVIHADAGIDSKSVEARKDNFRQLAEMINSRTEDRALILIGDYNSMYSRNLDDDLYTNLVSAAGLTDCWAELCNGGDYTYDNGNNWDPTLNESLDRVMFKSGGGIELTAVSYEYLQFINEDGETYTDHSPVKAAISYKVTGCTSVPAELTTETPIDRTQRQSDEFKAILDSFILIVSNLDELFYLLGQGIDLLFSN